MERLSERSRRLDLFSEALGAVARNQSRLTPQETELLVTRLVGAYELSEITAVVNETLAPKAMSKTPGQKEK